MAGGKTYQVTQVDPFNPHTKGMVYQVNIVGGGTQMEELPEASADNVGLVYQYLGESDANFTHGYFYENKAQGTNPETYAWEAIDTQAGGVISTANTDLSNLTGIGKNIGNWSSNVTNCITEIPQDINLTLSNGTLTLKAGSKVYVPNGAGVFDEITVPADRTLTSGATWQFMVLYNKTSGDFYRNTDMAHQYSGNTAPENPTNQTIWYDTANNLVKMYLNGAWTSDWSFPLALVTATGSISSIDQVFNGFGYIGSTVFALPGVKGLKPNGRNADGTLKSTVITKTNVSIGTYTGTSPIYFGISSSTSPVYFQSDTGYSYDPETNTTNWGVAILGHFRATAGVISNWKPKIAFHAVDYSDTEFIANQAMPSNKYLGLSLGATGTTYTAPGNGYFTVTKQAGASGEYIYIANNANGMNSGIMATGALNCRCFLPVSKGDSVQINYTLTGTTNTFRFVYANGAK